ncbi:MAG: GNAT family N-acetyltransferase [Bacteroidales bacterium]|nr:GNAT family N-acetyltransferase [Bacteroidales bacterium]
MSEYRFETIDLSEKGIRETSDLLTSVFGPTAGLSPSFIDWEYNQNPTGKAVGFNAWMGEVLAAHYVTQPLVADFEGKKTRGLLSLNTATHANHRGKKLFTILADKTYERGLELGYEFVIGVANANSTPGFLKNLGFSLICPLDVKFGIGAPNIGKTLAADYSRHWDKDSLKWRLANPKLKYEIKKTNTHFIVFAPTGKYGIRAVIGIFPLSSFPEMLSLPSRRGINPANIWMGLDDQLNWQGKLFFNFPDHLKPSPLNLIFKDLTGKNRIPDASHFKFMSIDFDAY